MILFVDKWQNLKRGQISSAVYMDGMLGVGNHISHYLLPIINTFEVDDKKMNPLLQKYSKNKMAAIFSPKNVSIVILPKVEPCKWVYTNVFCGLLMHDMSRLI